MTIGRRQRILYEKIEKCSLDCNSEVAIDTESEKQFQHEPYGVTETSCKHEADDATVLGFQDTRGRVINNTRNEMNSPAGMSHTLTVTDEAFLLIKLKLMINRYVH